MARADHEKILIMPFETETETIQNEDRGARSGVASPPPAGSSRWSNQYLLKKPFGAMFSPADQPPPDSAL
jgi:hypothetical protein